jgi:hypothetical protein
MAGTHDRGGQADFRIERFVFPDGMSVELMVFQQQPARRRAAPLPGPCVAPPPGPCAAPPPGPADATETPARANDAADAGRCPVCGGRLVYPLDWRRTSRSTWTLRLRCPDCETLRCVIMDRVAVEQLNRELYRARQAVAAESQALTRRHFKEEAERIAAALASGLIQPMDF